MGGGRKCFVKSQTPKIFDIGRAIIPHYLYFSDMKKFVQFLA